MQRIKLIPIFLALTMFVMLGFAGTRPAIAQPSEVWVNADYCEGCPNDGHTWGYDAFSKIQDGIDAVGSPGTVYVTAGTYYESITLKDRVVVQGAGASVTTIDAGEDGSVVTAASVGADTVLDGLTLQNGRTDGIFGAGIDISFASPVIRNNIIRNNQGWGIGTRGASTPRIEKNIVSENSGGIEVFASQPIITSNLIKGNVGYGVETGNTNHFTIVNNVVADNGSDGFILQFFLSADGDANVMNNTIVENSGDGVRCNRSPFLALLNNVVVSNGNCGIFFISDYDWGAPNSDFNDVWGNSHVDYGGLAATGAHDVSEDPIFVDPYNGNYHLWSGSPCIDAGTSEEAPEVDFEGDQRPIDGNGDNIAVVDIGADEAGLLPSYDVAPLLMIPPIVQLKLGTSFIPQAEVMNIGAQSAIEFTVTCEIRLIDSVIYSDTRPISEITSFESIDVVFSDWIPDEVGEYELRIYTELAGDENTANDTQIRTVNVTTLVADFASNLTEGHVPLEVQFADQSTGNVTEWLWDFGDGNTSNEQNPIHTYNSCGIYTVSLTISNPTLSDTETKIGFIMVLPDIFGVDLGNVWTYQGTYQESPYTGEEEVVSLDESTFPTTTYVFEIRENGILQGKGYYEKACGQLKLWGGYFYGDMLKFSAGLVVAWYPMEVNDHEYSSATTEFYGYVFDVSMTVDVLSKEPVALGFDSFEAYKVRYRFRIWGYGEEETETFYQWVVPYLRVVKYEDAESLEELTAFAIGGGPITQETDTDFDGLKDYQELVVYNTNWQVPDTDGDGLTDGDEVNTYGTDPNSTDTDNDGITDSDELALGTDPTQSDTDADGLTDGDEVNIHGTDPKIADTDADDLKDGDEVNIHGTDPLNSDTDGDVMPDGWEVTYGLNPLVDDADDDLDGDGVKNIDEYNDGSNPNNKNPAKPELFAPEDGAINVALAPTLETSPFSDPEDDGHARTEWQISTQLDDFSDDQLAFKAESDLALTALTVTDYVLKENTSYYWRARFTDDEGAKSEWSNVYGFETGASTVIDQNPANGVPDSQDLDGGDPAQSELDLDDNGTFDVNELSDTWKCLNTEAGDGHVGVKVQPGYILNAVESVDPASISDTVNKPNILPHTLVSFSVKVPNAVDSVDITVYLSGTLPTNTQWYTWNAASGWQQFPATFSQTSAGDTKVVFTKTDGGTGDADGLANGIIIDPSGPGTVSAPPPAAGGGGGGGCFIATAGE